MAESTTAFSRETEAGVDAVWATCDVMVGRL